MNTFMDKIRDVLTAVIGKVLLGVFGISFIVTLLLSIVQKSGVLISIPKAIMSAFFVTLIFYILYFILNKVLSDVINEVNIENNDISFDVENSSIAGYNSENNNTKQEEKEESIPLEIVSGDIVSDNEIDTVEEITAKEKTATHKPESVVDKKPEIKNNSIDKKDKLSYDNKENKSKSASFDTGFVDFSSNDDIGSIIFADKVNAAVESSEKPLSSSTTSSSKTSSDGFIDFSKAAKADPDMMAKAIRSMRSKDEEK